MPSDLLLILDNKSSLFTYTGGPWTTILFPDWYEGSSSYPAFAPGLGNANTSYGSLSITFNGTSIAFIGNTPPSTASQVMTITIDGNVPYNSSYSDPNPQSYRQWYQSPRLEDGPHKIVVNNIDGTALDYAIITAGQSNRFDENSRVIVDDDDELFKYVGNWRRSKGEFDSVHLPDGTPFYNITHQTNQLGDTATINFAGTSIAVYGIFTWTEFGVIDATYTLDNMTTSRTYTVSPSSKEYVNGGGDQQNYQLFTSDILDASNHTLSINITRCENLTYSLDYITYIPSFGSLAAMPDLRNETLQSPSTTSSISSPKGDSNRHSFTPVGAIVGAVMGGTLFFILIALAFILWRRRRFADDGYMKSRENGTQSQLIVDPFTLEDDLHNLPQMGDNTVTITSPYYKTTNRLSYTPIPTSEKVSRRSEVVSHTVERTGHNHAESSQVENMTPPVLQQEAYSAGPSPAISTRTSVPHRGVIPVDSLRMAPASPTPEAAPPAYDDIPNSQD